MPYLLIIQMLRARVIRADGWSVSGQTVVQRTAEMAAHLLDRRQAIRRGNAFGSFVTPAIGTGPRVGATITRRGTRILLGTRRTLGDGLSATALARGTARRPRH